VCERDRERRVGGSVEEELVRFVRSHLRKPQRSMNGR
jgi:hypothetical protein